MGAAGDEADVGGERPECHPEKFWHHYISWGQRRGRQGMDGGLYAPEWLVLYLRESILCIYSIGEENGNPLPCSCLESPRDGGAWWAAVYGVAQSQTRLKRLSSSSSIVYISSIYFLYISYIF